MPRALHNFRRLPIILGGIFARQQQPGIHFLLYHKVSGELPLELDLAYPLFQRQMEFLHRTKRVISYDDAVRRLLAAERLPNDLFVLTFDDGYEDFYSHAFPVLRDLGLPAILFITTAFIEHKTPCVLRVPPPQGVKPLSWEMVAELIGSGLIALGGHSHNHIELPNASEAQALEELTGSLDLVKRRVGITLRHFAYPRARWNERVELLVKGVYDSAVLAGWSKARLEGFDPYRIPRVPILRRDKWMFFVAKTRGWLEKERKLYERIAH